MAVVLKTTEPETVPGVRIPLPPPTYAHACQRLRELRLASHAKVVRRSLGEGGRHIHSFFSTLIRRQVVEKWRRYGGSIESNSAERDPFRKEQLLQRTEREVVVLLARETREVVGTAT